MDSLYEKLRSGDLCPEEVLAIIKGTEAGPKEALCYYEECLSIQPRDGTLPTKEDKTLLFIAEDMESINKFCNNYGYFSENAISVYIGNEPSSNMKYNYQINKTDSASYINLYEQLNEKKCSEWDIIYFSQSRNTGADTWAKEIDNSIQTAYSITQLIRAFSKDYSTIRFIHGFTKDNYTNYVNIAVSGMLKTISVECSNVMHKNIQFENMNEREICSRLIEEVNFDISDGTDISYISNKRYISEFKPIHKSIETENKQLDIFNQGVFIVTGGMGALGQILAEQILVYRPQRVYLLGRKYPDKAILDSVTRIDPSSTIIKYLQCDIEDSIACQQVIENILEKDGHVTGLFHCAGVIRDAIIVNLKLEDFYQSVNPKIKGLINILDSFIKYGLDMKFVKLYSSITSVMGNMGQTAYSYANGYLNAFAYDIQSKYHMFNIQAICWPYWEQGGLTVDGEKLNRLYEQTGQKPLSTANGKIALENLMSSDSKCPIAMYGDKAKISRYVKEVRQQKAYTMEENKIQGDEIVSASGLTKEDVTDYIQGIISDIIKLPKSKLNITTTWENYGIDSLAIMRFNEIIEDVIPNCPKTLMYEYRNIEALSECFFEKYGDRLEKVLKKEIAPAPQKVKSSVPDKGLGAIQNNRFKKITQEKATPSEIKSDVAIIGIAGRYPKADTLDEFWNNLLEGRDCVVEIPSDRWDYSEDYNTDKSKHGYTNSKWGGFINDFDCFDAAFFKITPREARYMDPQERIFLECAWHGLEDAGYTAKMLKKHQVGVFAGIMYSHYQLYGIDYDKPGHKMAFNSSYASVSNRVSYHMDFHGPSIAIDTMCSSSLTAIHLACESIYNGSSSIAIAGGVNLSLHPNKYINLSQNNFLSSEGKCRSFGEGGDGYVPSEGVGVVILKKLEEAKRDNDIIYGVIKAAAINHGGSSNGFTVPNPVAQTEVIQKALKEAKTDAANITYVETHGTGTPLGDPIELSALTKAYGITEKCAVGSIKSNMGHAESAAGMAGLTKVILQMKYKKLVPSIHCDQLNKNINFNELPFVVQKKTETWEHKKSNGKDIPYLAGLSAFGAGGSNAHLLIEEYADKQDIKQKLGNLDYNILVISAKNKKDLVNYCHTYIKYLRESRDNNVALEQICYATQFYRNLLNEKLAVIGLDYEDMINKLVSFINSAQEQEDIIYVSEEDENDDINKFEYKFNRNPKRQDFINLAREVFYSSNDDWSIMWGDIKYPKINLPLYPFEKKRYWLSEDWKKPEAKAESLTSASAMNRLHNLSTLKEIKFKTLFNVSDFFVKDHKVKGKLILPGAAIAINAKAIGNILAEGKLKSIDDLTFVSPVSFENEEVELISYVDNKTLDIKTKMVSGTREIAIGIGNLNLKKELELNYVPDIEAINRRCNQKIFSEQLYKSIKQHGLEYGGSLGIIEKISYSEEEALVELKSFKQNYSNYFEAEYDSTVIPCIDAAFQSVFVFGNKFDLGDNKVILPYRIGSISCNKSSFTPEYIHVICNNTKDINFDIQIIDDKGRAQIKIEKLSMMEIKEKKYDIPDILRLLKGNEITLEKAAAILEEEFNDK